MILAVNERDYDYLDCCEQDDNNIFLSIEARATMIHYQPNHTCNQQNETYNEKTLRKERLNWVLKEVGCSV